MLLSEKRCQVESSVVIFPLKFIAGVTLFIVASVDFISQATVTVRNKYLSEHAFHFVSTESVSSKVTFMREKSVTI